MVRLRHTLLVLHRAQHIIRRMRPLHSTVVALSVLLTLCAGCLSASASASRASAASSSQSPTPSTTASPPPTNAQNPAIAWLEKLEARGEEIESFQAKVTYRRFKPLIGDRQTRLGEIAFLDPNQAKGKERGGEGGGPRFRIHFTRLIVGNALRRRETIYVFDGRWLVSKYPDKKLFIKRQVVPPGEQLNPLKLGQGPFPIPLGQEREQVLARFRVQLIPPDKDDPPHTVHLRLTPREKLPEDAPAARYERIDLWFHRETLLPRRIVALDDKGRKTTVILRDVKVNALSPKEAERLFEVMPPSGAGWRVEIVPWERRKG